MTANGRQPGQPVGRHDIDWLMRQPGVSGVLEGTEPLHIITEDQLPPETRQAIHDRFGADKVTFDPSGPIVAQAAGAGGAGATPPAPAAAPGPSRAAGVRVAQLRQFKQDSTRG